MVRSGCREPFVSTVLSLRQYAVVMKGQDSGSLPHSNAQAVSEGGKRPYMRHEHRRQMLLGAAAELVETKGWAALSMSALAACAGTSRQLVYHHFANLETLMVNTAWHIFRDVIEGTRSSISAHPDDMFDAIKAAENVSLDMPPGRGDALWQLIAGTAGDTPELDRIRRDIRSLISSTWMEPVQKHFGLDADTARVFSWITVMGFWGMRQLVRDGAIDRERGMAIFDDFMQRMIAGSRGGPLPDGKP